MSETENTNNTAIIHSVFEGQPLRDYLGDRGINVVYHSDMIPSEFNKMLEKNQIIGAIMHNTTLNDEREIILAAENGKKLIVVSQAGINHDNLKHHKDMYDRLAQKGVKILGRFTSNEKIYEEYQAMLQESQDDK